MFKECVTEVLLSEFILVELKLFYLNHDLVPSYIKILIVLSMSWFIFDNFL